MTDDYTKQLEAENQRLRARLASAGDVSPPPEVNRSVEPRVTITHLPDRNSRFVMPSSDELRRLYRIVLARYPQLATRAQQTDETFDGFCRAFLRVGHLGRDRLNDRYTLVSWADDARFWLNDQQISPSAVTGNDFVCAVLAHGDIDYVPLDRFPFDCSAFGLRRDSTGRPTTDGWRAVLATGRLRNPRPNGPRPEGGRCEILMLLQTNRDGGAPYITYTGVANRPTPREPASRRTPWHLRPAVSHHCWCRVV